MKNTIVPKKKLRGTREKSTEQVIVNSFNLHIRGFVFDFLLRSIIYVPYTVRENLSYEETLQGDYSRLR